MIKQFYSENYNDNHQCINVEIIDFFDPNNQEKREDFWINQLRALYSGGLNYKRINEHFWMKKLRTLYSGGTNYKRINNH